MAYTYPTVNDFKNYFVRDFPYGTDINTSVLDQDISKAQDEAKFNFNAGFASSQEKFTILFNYLTAHYLVMDLRAASQGIAGKFTWLTSSKGVGSVSESFAIPDRILANPELSYYTETNYGAKYLSLILPQLSGQMFSVCGRTHA